MVSPFPLAVGPVVEDPKVADEALFALADDIVCSHT
jgi:hypothetical protein